MNKVIMDNVKITINPLSMSNNKLRYTTNKYTYDIITRKNYVYNHYEPIVRILYNESDYSRKFLSVREDRIPEIHCEILLELFEIYKNKIILPMILTDNVKYINNLIFAKGLKNEK